MPPVPERNRLVASITDSERTALKDRGMLYASAVEEEAFLEQSVCAAWTRMRQHQLEMYVVCPTLACNLACGYCFEGDSLIDKQQGVMTESQVDLMFGAIGAIRAGLGSADDSAGTPGPYAPWISLFGGEPLLPNTKRCGAGILARAAAGGFAVGATTNGVNITRYADISTNHCESLTLFQVTLDGTREVHNARRHWLGGQGTCDEIVAALTCCCRWMSMRTCVLTWTPRTYSRLWSFPTLSLRRRGIATPLFRSILRL